MTLSTAPAPDTARTASHTEKIIVRLLQGPATNRELAQISLKYTSRISDVRDAGYIVNCRRLDGGLMEYSLA